MSLALQHTKCFAIIDGAMFVFLTERDRKLTETLILDELEKRKKDIVGYRKKGNDIKIIREIEIVQKVIRE